MDEFKKGQRVRVEFEGEVTDTHPEGLYVRITGTRTAYIPFYEDVFTLLDPPSWPPQAGDIWEASGEEWFARKGNLLRLYVVSSEPGKSLEIDNFKALNPVLVRRRGQ